MINLLELQTFKHLKKTPYTYTINNKKIVFGLYIKYNCSLSIEYMPYVVCLTPVGDNIKGLNLCLDKGLKVEDEEIIKEEKAKGLKA